MYNYSRWKKHQGDTTDMRVTLWKNVEGTNLKHEINKVEGVLNFDNGNIRICKFNSEGNWIEEDYEKGKSFDFFAVYEN